MPNSPKLHFTTSIKVLVLTMDSNLHLKNPEICIIRKSYGVLNVLYSNRSVLSRLLKFLLSNTLVLFLLVIASFFTVPGSLLLKADAFRVYKAPACVLYAVFVDVMDSRISWQRQRG